MKTCARPGCTNTISLTAKSNQLYCTDEECRRVRRNSRKRKSQRKPTPRLRRPHDPFILAGIDPEYAASVGLVDDHDIPPAPWGNLKAPTPPKHELCLTCKRTLVILERREEPIVTVASVPTGNGLYQCAACANRHDSPLAA